MSIELHHADNVATIILSRELSLNALTFEMYKELTSMFSSSNALMNAKAVVITGKGRGFCAGGDRDHIIAKLIDAPQEKLDWFAQLTCQLITHIRHYPQPVIAAINGVAVGAGAVIAAACDLRVASPHARIGFVFPQVGLSGADMGACYLLPRLIGTGRASELLLLGDIIDADKAYQMGLFNVVTEDALGYAKQWATQLTQGTAHDITKRMLRLEESMDFDEAMKAEAKTQADCMAKPSFKKAYENSIKQRMLHKGEGR